MCVEVWRVFWCQSSVPCTFVRKYLMDTISDKTDGAECLGGSSTGPGLVLKSSRRYWIHPLRQYFWRDISAKKMQFFTEPISEENLTVQEEKVKMCQNLQKWPKLVECIERSKPFVRTQLQRYCKKYGTLSELWIGRFSRCSVLTIGSWPPSRSEILSQIF